MRLRIVAATVGGVLALSLLAATVAVVAGTDLMQRAYPESAPYLTALIAGLVLVVGLIALAYAAVGVLLARQQGAGRVAALLVLGALGITAVPFGYIVGGGLAISRPGDPLAAALFLIGPALNGPGFAALLPALAIGFPDGRLPSRRWRIPVTLAGLILLGSSLVAILRPGSIVGMEGTSSPFAIAGLPAPIADSGGLLEALGVLLTALLGLAAVFSRYRSGTTLVQHQLRWFLAAVSIAAIPLAISVQPVIGGPQWFLIATVGLLLVPVSVGIAVTRYRLYEIDRLISRGLSWGLLTGMLVAVYAAAVLVLQGALAGVTQGQTLAVAASTLLAAALFQPLRGRLQHLLDRRFDRGRYDAEQTMELFAERIRNEVDLGTLRADVEATAGRSLRPLAVGLWLRARGRTGR
jgi:hypothetical protein